MPTFSFFLPDEAATEQLGSQIARRLQARDLVALHGGLGVGKTTLARAILRAATGDPDLIVPSPTFTLVEVYDTQRGMFWHFDLYRLESPEQVFELGWEEARADGIALVEWAEHFCLQETQTIGYRLCMYLNVPIMSQWAVLPAL